MEDVASGAGQAILLTRVIMEAPKQAVVSQVAPEPEKPRAVTQNQEASKKTAKPEEPAIDEQSLPVVKKAVPLSPKQQARSAYQQAQKELSRGSDQVAIQSLRKSVGSYPLPEAYVALAGLLVSQGNMSEARQLLEQGLKAIPGHADIAYLLARLQLDAGLTEQSRATLINALTSGRSNADYLALLGAVSQKLKRYAESAQAYVEALRLKPGQANWWMGLGLTLESQEKTAQAVEAYYKSLSTGLDDQFQSFVLKRIQLLEGVQQ
jgi:MSHA biogenesis protein MshN